MRFFGPAGCTSPLPARSVMLGAIDITRPAPIAEGIGLIVTPAGRL